MVERHRAPTFYLVPAGTAPAKCRSNQCQATIYFIDSKRTPGKKIPIDCSVVGGRAPTELETGTGIIHHIVCADAEMFREKRPPARRRGQRELDVDHKPPSCIFCGCTEKRACLIPVEELDLGAALDAEIFAQGGLVNGQHVVPCHWLQLAPPICSAPACAKQRDELPLRMKVKKPAGKR